MISNILFLSLISVFLLALIVPIFLVSKGPKAILLLQISFTSICVLFLLLANGENAAVAQFYAIALGVTSTAFLVLLSLIYEKKLE